MDLFLPAASLSRNLNMLHSNNKVMTVKNTTMKQITPDWPNIQILSFYHTAIANNPAPCSRNNQKYYNL